MKKVWFYFILAICNWYLFQWQLHAEEIKFENFSFENGLQASNVLSIFQDSKGFIYLRILNQKNIDSNKATSNSNLHARWVSVFKFIDLI